MFIKGNYKKSIFNGTNGYVIGLFKVKESSEDISYLIGTTITFTGYFHELNENDTYIMNGEIVNHKKYGEQFNVSNYERVKPEDKDSIVQFLSSGLFKGIGSKKAERIVDALGSDTLNTILENPSNLLLIPTITKKQVDILHNTMLEYESSYSTILKLTEMGFNTKDSMVIYNKYKNKTLDIIEENIYKIYYEIKDIYFNTIDKIALKNNYSKDDSRRISAVIFYVFTELTYTVGSCYFSIDTIYNYTLKVLSVSISDEEFINSLNTLIIDLKVVKENEKYYLKSIKECEENVSKRIAYLTRLNDKKIKNIDQYIKNMELRFNILYDKNQRKAIEESLLKNILVITGGPGSGKTTIIKSIVNLYIDINKISYEKAIDEIALLAPTGRASKRLSSSSVFPATTIHRFLKWNKDTDKFSVNEYNKSNVKFVIIDEASMIDINLLDSLFKGLRVDTRVVIVGDYNQLPSVGPGQVLKDIIDSETVPVIQLDRIHRQEEGSNITLLAYNINDGFFNKSIFNEDDVIFKKSNDIKKDIELLASKYKDYDFKEFQILCPMYKTINGIDYLNKILQNIFNPKSKNKNEVYVDGIIYRECDKVLQLTNMPDDNVFNGDIGIISRIGEKEIVIDFDGNFVKYSPSNYKKFKHAYVISIHKSQGSEFETVILPITKGYSKMLYRKLYYTAVTRAKKKLIFLGEIDALKYAIENNISDNRNTTLKEQLSNRINFNE